MKYSSVQSERLQQWLYHIGFLVAHFLLAYELGGFGYLSAMFNVFVDVLVREKNGQKLRQ